LGLGFRVYNLGFRSRVKELGFVIAGNILRVKVLGLRVKGLWLKGLGFRVSG
jgi:hypothetical protein